jgi:hypothetical protein
MLLDIAPGSVACPSVNNTGTVLCHSDAVEHLTLDPAPPAGQDRVDMVICQSRGADLDGGINNDFVFAIVKGTPYTPPYNGVRDDPPIPPGAVALARVGVVGGTVTPGRIDDFRPGPLSLSQIPAARIYPATQTVIQNGPILLDATNYLRGGFTKSADNFSLIIPVPGIYHFHAQIWWENGYSVPPPTAYAFVAIMRNGAEIRNYADNSSFATWVAPAGGDDDHFSRGDTLSINGSFAAAPMGVWNDPYRTYLSAHLVSPDE